MTIPANRLNSGICIHHQTYICIYYHTQSNLSMSPRRLRALKISGVKKTERSDPLGLCLCGGAKHFIALRYRLEGDVVLLLVFFRIGARRRMDGEAFATVERMPTYVCHYVRYVHVAAGAFPLSCFALICRILQLMH